MANLTLSLDDTPPAACRQGALSIGNFDGVHRGHQALLARTRHHAKTMGGPAVVLTFDPHPLQILRPQEFQPVLTALADRLALLEQYVDHVIGLRATPELLHLTAEEFFARVVRAGLQPRTLVEGYNFCFGRGRQGTVQTLVELCRQAEIHFEVVAPEQLHGTPVSSSRVRKALLQGNVKEAAELLGRCYSLHGEVGSGQHRGQKLGFPTANLERIPSLIPGDGVYAVRIHWKGDWWPGAANIGPNPTFGEQARKVEVHLIGFTGDLYSQSLTVSFIDRIRATQAFRSVEELVAQLRSDINQAKTLAGGPHE
jgi:riboflavin kinase / FMN adenylyltransferase